MDAVGEDVHLQLSHLQAKAYVSVLKCLTQQEFDWTKDKLLYDLRKQLAISDEQHSEFLSAVLEGRDAVPSLPGSDEDHYDYDAAGGAPASTAAPRLGGPGACRGSAAGAAAVPHPPAAAHGGRYRGTATGAMVAATTPHGPESSAGGPAGHDGDGAGTTGGLSQISTTSAETATGGGAVVRSAPPAPAAAAAPAPAAPRPTVAGRTSAGGRAAAGGRGPAAAAAPANAALAASDFMANAKQRVAEKLMAPAESRELPMQTASPKSARGSRGGAEGTRGGAEFRGAPTQAASPPILPIPPAAGPGRMDPLVGCRVKRWWPEHGGWLEGAVTDFNLDTGEHCIAYDLGTPDESWEWFHVRNATPAQVRLVPGSRINLLQMGTSTTAAATKHAAASAPIASGGGRGGGRGNGFKRLSKGGAGLSKRSRVW